MKIINGIIIDEISDGLVHFTVHTTVADAIESLNEFIADATEFGMPLMMVNAAEAQLEALLEQVK
jgi:hypothetical protein